MGAKSGVNRGWRWAPALLAVLAMLFAPVSQLAAQPEPVTEFGKYQSQFGFFFYYDAGAWDIINEETEPGVRDFVRFTDGEIWVDIEPFSASFSAQECMQNILASLEALPGFVRMENLWQGGPPQVKTNPQGTSAEVMLVLVMEGEDGKEAFVKREVCEALLPRISLLHRAATISLDTYNAGRGHAFLFQESIDYGLRLVTFTPQGELASPNAVLEDAHDAQVIADGEGGLALAETHLWCFTNDHYGFVYNFTRDRVFLVDPSRFGPKAPGERFRAQPPEWLFPAKFDDAPFPLAPGQSILFRIGNPDPDAPYTYKPPQSDAYTLAEWGVCGGSGIAAPVVIDLD